MQIDARQGDQGVKVSRWRLGLGDSRRRGGRAREEETRETRGGLEQTGRGEGMGPQGYIQEQEQERESRSCGIGAAENITAHHPPLPSRPLPSALVLDLPDEAGGRSRGDSTDRNWRHEGPCRRSPELARRRGRVPGRAADWRGRGYGSHLHSARLVISVPGAANAGSWLGGLPGREATGQKCRPVVGDLGGYVTAPAHPSSPSHLAPAPVSQDGVWMCATPAGSHPCLRRPRPPIGCPRQASWKQLPNQRGGRV